ncbi:Beta-amyrin synthase [Spatholobus suberectus]|nr:Beta-amyrin synthase [Spatholobus suberectus]
MWRLKIADGGKDPHIFSTNNFLGRQIWEFDPEAGTAEERAQVETARQNFYRNRFNVKTCGDRLWRFQILREKNFKQTITSVNIQDDEEISYEETTITLKRAAHYLSALQTGDGHWPAQSAGPLFFIPPLVFCMYITGHLDSIFLEEYRKEILRYIYCHQILGVVDWCGNNPLPPEFWILPSFLPMHPAKMWCYCRLVYMPMSYLYGKKFVGPITPLILNLREELFTQPYDINSWKKARHKCAQILCMLACWVEDSNGDAFKKHLARIPDYLWVSEDGMTLQVMDNPLGDFKSMHRHISKGSWAFSDKDHGWQLSDCTAECLTCCMLLSMMPQEIVGEKVEPEKLYDSINVLLSLQSKNGGITAWEPAGTQKWLEILNPTELFADIVLEHEYVECTGSAILALVLFKELYPKHRKKEIENFIAKAVQFIEDEQSTDGSWYGKWGICFTYCSWFALRGLVAAGKTYTNCVAIRKAVKFLLSKQNKDGGWGESYLSCPRKMYVPLEGNRSNIVQTAWVLMALIHAGQVFFKCAHV